MKRFVSVLLSISLLSISSCSKIESITQSSDAGSAPLSSETSEQVQETIELTVSAGYLADDLTQEEVDQNVADTDGYLSGVLNDDGSVTYVMTMEKYQEQLDQCVEGFDQSNQELIDSGEHPNIVSITHNENFTEFTIEYSVEEVELADSMLALTFYMEGGIYSMLSGEEIDDVHVMFVDAETGELLCDSHSSDMGGDDESGDEQTDVERLQEVCCDVTELWNEVFVEVSSYSATGTSCTGTTLDIDFVLMHMDEYYAKVTEDKEFVDSLGEEYSDIIVAFDNMYEQATILYNYLKENTPSPNTPLPCSDAMDLFQQYFNYFYDAVWEL